MNRILMFAVTVGLAAFPIGCDSTTQPSNQDGSMADLSGAATSDLATPGVSCAQYCQIIQQNCTAGNSQFPNAQSCLNACANLPVGTVGQTSGDTVGCRTYHSMAAAADPATHCPHAGPSGGGTCGADRCQAFCELASVVCIAANGVPATFPFKSKTECLNQCGTAPFKFDPTMPEQMLTGKTLNCAFYHLTEAFVSPNTDGGATAMDHCEDFDPANAMRGCM